MKNTFDLYILLHIARLKFPAQLSTALVTSSLNLLAILSTQEVNNKFDGSAAADSVVTVTSFILISFVWKRYVD